MERLQEGLTQGMHPLGGRRSGRQELEEVRLSQWGGHLGTKGGSFESDALKLPAETGDLIQRPRSSGVEVHRGRLREGVRAGIIHPTTNEFPGPEQFQGLISRQAKSLTDGGRGARDRGSCSRPPANQPGQITSQLSRRDPLTPHYKRAIQKGTTGGERIRAWKGRGALWWWLIWGAPR